MIKAIIIDDERNSRDIISLMLEKYCPGVTAVAVAANCKEGIAQIKAHQPQLVFLDLEMPDGTGFDVLAGAYDGSFEAVFVTAFEKRFLHAIRFSEVELILKPIDKESLLQAVDTIVQRIDRGVSKTRYDILLKNFDPNDHFAKLLVIPQDSGTETSIRINEIDYFESQSDRTVFHLSNGTQVPAARSFRYYAELFAPLRFYQVNNVQMVQLAHIEKLDQVSNQVQLRGGSKLEVTERRKKELIAIWK
ncbi:LytTR family two component transcriptional regulator [Chitinophaga skermanii]|uniref:LytTR family two component transcriptional regulator n=1 Tax=Chitinophaga skermanii TaxID=331697 RepID=A0A327R0P5_9BACT|nr:LytTR family DNA-binding domain-containing protein [Chitinophaga skermanii]RAJ10429.1 LytTR family two component transcriptional regulator [Chitinophaga skermanii]